MQVPHNFSSLRFWRDTSVARLQPGQRRTIKPGLLGHEWDEDIDNGWRPAGLVRLSQTKASHIHQYCDAF